MYFCLYMSTYNIQSILVTYKQKYTQHYTIEYYWCWGGRRGNVTILSPSLQSVVLMVV